MANPDQTEQELQELQRMILLWVSLAKKEVTVEILFLKRKHSVVSYGILVFELFCTSL